MGGNGKSGARSKRYLRMAMRRHSMPLYKAGWKASARRLWLNWPNGFIFRLMT